MGPAFEIEVYPARRGLLLRQQWRARTVSINNRKRITGTLEGYNNRQEVIDIMARLHPTLPIFQVVTGGGRRLVRPASNMADERARQSREQRIRAAIEIELTRQAKSLTVGIPHVQNLGGSRSVLDGEFDLGQLAARIADAI